MQPCVSAAACKHLSSFLMQMLGRVTQDVKRMGPYLGVIKHRLQPSAFVFVAVVVRSVRGRTAHVPGTIGVVCTAAMLTATSHHGGKKR